MTWMQTGSEPLAEPFRVNRPGRQKKRGLIRAMT